MCLSGDTPLQAQTVQVVQSGQRKFAHPANLEVDTIVPPEYASWQISARIFPAERPHHAITFLNDGISDIVDAKQAGVKPL